MSKWIAFYLNLGVFYGFADHRMLDGRVLVEAGPVHEAFDAVAAEAADDVVFQ